MSERVESTGLGQSNASNHPACLLDCGLVASEQRRRFVYYRLADERVTGLLSLAGEILTAFARGVHACPSYGPREESAS